jgi:predicted kinase
MLLKKNIVYITKGFPASGKTTWARKFISDSNGKCKRVNKDDLRNMLDNDIYNQENELFICKIRDNIILDALKNNFDVIVDDTNVNPKHIEDIKILVGDLAEIIIKDFTYIPIKELYIRDSRRKKKVGKSVIRKMFEKYSSN